MIVGKTYLVKIGEDVREIKCIQESTLAYKLENILDADGAYSINNFQYWILKTDISTDNSQKYQILEEL